MRSIALAIVLLASPVFAKNQNSPIEEAVQSCVDKIRQMPPKGDQFYQDFDAYYNPADGTVQNNVASNSEFDALFQFNKCMVQSGHPLTRKR